MDEVNGMAGLSSPGQNKSRQGNCNGINFVSWWNGVQPRQRSLRLITASGGEEKPSQPPSITLAPWTRLHWLAAFHLPRRCWRLGAPLVGCLFFPLLLFLPFIIPERRRPLKKKRNQLRSLFNGWWNWLSLFVCIGGALNPLLFAKRCSPSKPNSIFFHQQSGRWPPAFISFMNSINFI